MGLYKALDHGMTPGIFLIFSDVAERDVTTTEEIPINLHGHGSRKLKGLWRIGWRCYSCSEAQCSHWLWFITESFSFWRKGGKAMTLS